MATCDWVFFIGDLMAGYAKSWTDKYNDEWYLSLSLAERGLWDQLKDWAKLHGDTGGIFLSNLTHAGAVFGCDRKTAGRILGKFQADSKIDLSVSKTGVMIKILNYEYYQRVKRVGGSGTSGDYRENSPKPPPISRADKSRADKSRADKSRADHNPPPSFPNCPIQKIQDLFNQLCPSLPNIKSIEGTRLSNLRPRWKAHPDLEFWSQFFVTVEASDFLAGRIQTDRPWSCGFDWIIKSANFTKIVEGTYQNKQPQGELLSKAALATARNADIAREVIEKRDRENEPTR